jgi:hypothetical protein
MNKNEEIMALVAFFWVAIILASIVILAPVSPMFGPLIIEIGGAVACLSLMWSENKREIEKTSK